MSFSAFKTKFSKSYASPAHEAQAKLAFMATLDRIEQKNLAHVAAGGEAVFGVTKFADLSPAEFKRLYLGYRPAKGAAAAAVAGGVAAVAPRLATSQLSCLVNGNNSTCDWRRANAVSPVKDQQQCGSCWAFSATEEIESMTFMKTGSMPILSPQQIVSCDMVDQGCNGGDTPTAYAYVQQTGGLTTDKAYPYESGSGDSGTCSLNPSGIVANIRGFTYATPPCSTTCDHQNEELLAQNMVATGPVSVCLNAAPWQDYVGGILSSGCSHAFADLDHCVQLVGFDNTGTTTFWWLRNSWNTDWGIDGYIKVAKAGNLCGVANQATFAIPM